MHFPESCSYCFAASKHKDLFIHDTYVFHTKSILTLARAYFLRPRKMLHSSTGQGAWPPLPPLPASIERAKDQHQ